MTIFDIGYAIMELNDEFANDYAPNMGWEDPFQKDLKLQKFSEEKFNGIKAWRVSKLPKEKMSTREEKDLWILRRDRFVMEHLFMQYSYEIARQWAENSYCADQLLEELSQKRVCECGDGQCTWDCGRWGTCGKEN